MGNQFQGFELAEPATAAGLEQWGANRIVCVLVYLGLGSTIIIKNIHGGDNGFFRAPCGATTVVGLLPSSTSIGMEDLFFKGEGCRGRVPFVAHRKGIN